MSTASAINATLYGSTRLTYSIARSGELPEPFGRTMHGNISEGLLITSVLTLVAANTLDLGRISTIGSAGFLVVFAAVKLARHRLRDAGDPGWPSLLGLLACLIALAALIAEVGGDDPIATAAAAGLFVGPFVIEAVYRGITGRSIRHRFHGASRHRHSTDD